MRIKTPTAIQIQNAITSMWNGRMTVYGNKSVFNEVTKITEIENDVVLAKDIPCRISVQEIKLFCAPEIEIVEGSRLVITQNDMTNTYEKSGTPAMYTYHQEIILSLVEDWS